MGEGLELLRFAGLQVESSECGRPDEQRHLVLFAEFADRPSLRRIEVVDHLLAQSHRRPDRDGETEGMEERQDPQQDLIRLEMDLLLDLMSIAQDVTVREDDALGVAGRARGENHRRLFVELVTSKPRDEQAQGICRYELGQGGGPEFVGQPDLLGDVLEHDQSPFRDDLELGKDLGGGHHVSDAALFDRRVDDPLTGAIVEIDGDFSPERDGEIRHGCGYGRRDHQTDVAGLPPGPREDTPEYQGAQERLAVSQGRPGAIGQGRLGRMRPHRVDECCRQ